MQELPKSETHVQKSTITFSLIIDLNPNDESCIYSTLLFVTHVQKSTITFLPIIDLNPNDESCIYSTLLFVIEQAKRMHVPVPCVTFDQPLWLKACGVIEEAGLDIVARLGGFDTLITYLGGIGKVMKGSGTEELFNEVYPENTVQHIISGKAVSRALRAHPGKRFQKCPDVDVKEDIIIPFTQ